MNFDHTLLNVQQMGQADRLAIAGGVSAYQLMENAGNAVVRAIQSRWSKRPVVVLCGPGNNGGDGFVVARSLKEKGWEVRVALLGSREQLRGEAGQHAQRWLGPIEPLAPTNLMGTELVVDALFGAGLNRPLDSIASATLQAAAQGKHVVVAIDVPSGLMGDTGESLGAIDVALTVTFFRKKPGHVLLPGRARCGEVVVADIGIPQSVFHEISPNTFENDPSLWLHAYPKRTEDGNKYTRGHALISGGYPMTGASRLAARAAARIGAGLTTLAVPEIGFSIYASSLLSVMVKPIVTEQDFEKLLEDSRYTGFLIGPGSGVHAETRQRAITMLQTKRATVLDADAISAFQDDPTALARAIEGACIMTPHEGEFRRLFDMQGDKLTRARMAAQQSRAVMLLKGSDTVIAEPSGRAIINTNAPPTLATAGAGDVLSGLVLGLIAQGMDAFLATAAAVWIHGAAATAFGPGLIADDLSEVLPTVLRQLEASMQNGLHLSDKE